MPDDDTTSGALGDTPQLSVAPAPGAVGSVPSDSMSLSELNEYLGKDFKDKSVALKALKDTFSYVGKKKEDIEREVLSTFQQNDKTDKLAQEMEQMRKDMFYKDNPQYASLRDVIEKVGGNPAEVVNQGWFKETYTKVSGYDESQKLKTVLESNPRLASSRDSLTKARELQATAGKNTDEVEQLVVNAVKDAYGL